MTKQWENLSKQMAAAGKELAEEASKGASRMGRKSRAC